MKILILLIAISSMSCTEVPDWVVRGVLLVESSSYFSSNGTLIYVDKRVGRSGERGPFQMTEIAFDTVKRPGEHFVNLQVDMALSEKTACRYLSLLYKRSNDWFLAIQMYNRGPGKKSATYLHKFKKATGR